MEAVIYKEEATMFKYLIIFSLLTPFIANAGSATGKVDGFVINEGGTFVSSDASTSSDYIECNTSKRFYFYHASSYSNYFLSAIIAANHAGTILGFHGTGNCFGNSEVLRKVCTSNIPC